MRRIRIACFACAALALNAVAVSAQSLPSTKEAADLVEKARSRVQLALPDAQPFHIVANLRYSFGDMELTGTYEVLWASAGRYREIFRMGPFSETDVALETQLYVMRNTLSPPYQLWRVRSLMVLPNEDPPTFTVPEEKVHTVRASASGGICAELGSKEAAKLRSSEVCLDAASDQIESQHSRSKSGTVEYLLEDFVNFGTTRYARHRLLTLAGATLEINVTKLEPVGRFAESVFMPPTDAVAKDWCPNPSVVGKYTGASLFQWPPQFGVHTFYVFVKADGHIEKAIQLYPDGQMILLRPLPHDFLPNRFPVHECAGKAIEYERVSESFEVPF
jgi:hypothetical protein